MPARLVGVELREADKSGSFSLRDRIDIDARVFVLLKTDGTQQRSVWEQDLKIGLMLLRDSFLDRSREHETLLALPRLVKPRTCSFKLGLERRKDLRDLIRPVFIDHRIGKIADQTDHGDQLIDACIGESPKALGLGLLHAVPPISCRCSR